MNYVDNIIASFGGIRPMAAIINKSPSTVHGWKNRGSIPDDQKRLIYDLAMTLKLPLDVHDFLPLAKEENE